MRFEVHKKNDSNDWVVASSWQNKFHHTSLPFNVLAVILPNEFNCWAHIQYQKNVASLEQQLEQLGAKHVVYFGCSRGGAASLIWAYALKWPHATGALAIVPQTDFLDEVRLKAITPYIPPMKLGNGDLADINHLPGENRFVKVLYSEGPGDRHFAERLTKQAKLCYISPENEDFIKWLKETQVPQQKPLDHAYFHQLGSYMLAKNLVDAEIISLFEQIKSL